MFSKRLDLFIIPYSTSLQILEKKYLQTSDLCDHEQLSLDHVKALVETHKKEKPDVCPTHKQVGCVSRWNTRKSKQSPLKSTFRKNPFKRCHAHRPLPYQEVVTESSFRGIFSHVLEDRCRFPALIGSGELTSSCYVLNCLLWKALYSSLSLKIILSAAAEHHMLLALISSQSKSVPPQAWACVFMWGILWLLENEERMIEEPLFMVSSQAVFTCTLLLPRPFARVFGSESKASLVQCETAGLNPTSLISASHTSFFPLLFILSFYFVAAGAQGHIFPTLKLGLSAVHMWLFPRKKKLLWLLPGQRTNWKFYSHLPEKDQGGGCQYRFRPNNCSSFLSKTLKIIFSAVVNLGFAACLPWWRQGTADSNVDPHEAKPHQASTHALLQCFIWI